MTSTTSVPDSEGIIDERINETKNNHFENGGGNLEEYRSIEEEEPCLPVVNNGNLFDKNKYGESENSLEKKPFKDLAEKQDKIYINDNSEYPLSNSKKKSKKNKIILSVGQLGNDGEKDYDWSRSKCENNIRKKLGLTHCGYLIGLFLVCATLLFLLVIIVLGSTWPHIPHRQKFPICIKSTCLRSAALVSKFIISFIFCKRKNEIYSSGL